MMITAYRFLNIEVKYETWSTRTSSASSSEDEEGNWIQLVNETTLRSLEQQQHRPQQTAGNAAAGTASIESDC